MLLFKRKRKNKKDKKKRKDRRWQNIRIALAAFALIITGILLLVINHIHDYRMNRFKDVAVLTSTGEPINIEYMFRYENLWKPIINNTGITLIVLGVGSLFLELHGYASYFQKKISEVFIEKEMLNILTKEYKKTA